MPGDRLDEVQAVKDGLLDSQVVLNQDTAAGRLQSEWQVIKDGLSQGFQQRKEHAQENLLGTGVEVATSFGVGAGLTTMLKAGGRWGKTAEIVGGVMLLGMAGDVARRSYGVYDAYSQNPGNTIKDQLLRKEAVAQNFGTAAFDYPVMFLSGGAGAGAAHFGPRMVNNFRTSINSASEFTIAPLGESAFGRNATMDLAINGRLGAKEKGSDILSVVRDRLDAPHKSVQLNELSALMEAKKIAAHPEVRPVYEQMSQTLAAVDKMKPQMVRDEAAVLAFEKQIGEIKGLKPEIQNVRSAEQAIAALKADVERLPGLTEQQSALSRQISEARKAQESKTKAPADETPVNIESLRETLQGVKEEIRGITARQQQESVLQSNFEAASKALAERKAAIEAGTDAEVAALNQSLNPLKSSLETKQGELKGLLDKLTELDKTYVAKAEQIRPSLNADDSGAIFDVPKYVRPKDVLADAPKMPPRVQRTETSRTTPEAPRAGTEASRISAESVRASEKGVTGRSDAASTAAPKPVEKVAAPANNRQPQANDRQSHGDRNSNRQNDRGQSRDQNAGRNQGDRRQNERETRADKAQQPARITQKDVDNAHLEAVRAVEDFTKTSKRHTTALKKVNDYIDTATAQFATDVQAANSVGKVVQNVESLLAKLENWERAPGWIRGADRAQVMLKQGLDAEGMARFDKWYESQNQLYIPRETMPELKLMAIQEHLQRRVAVESVKNWLRTASDVDAAVSPIVQKGFDIVRQGVLPDGRPIPKGSDLIVFEQKPGANGQPDSVLPFAKMGDKLQRFDDVKISEGLRKMEAMRKEGPQAFTAEELYGFRLDHDPSRLMAASNQVGYAILRPGGPYGKNVLFFELAPTVDAALYPKGLKADAPGVSGTNTGVIFNMLRNGNTPKK